MDVKKELQIFKAEFDKELASVLDEGIAEVKKHDQFVAKALIYFKKTILAGGKRVRPIMMQYGYLAAGGKKRKEIMRSAIGIEMIHAFLLMHDDIIDRDDLRHSELTMHAHYRTYGEKFLSKKEAEHFGISVGIIIGDLVYSMGNRAFFASNFSPKNIIRALTRSQEIVGMTGIGEMQDVYMEYRGKASEKAILTMYENKTARYTFEGPLHLGAILADGSEVLMKKMSAFAVPLGIAFQIQDDILGIFGDEKKLGKPVGSDIEEGKLTLLAIVAKRRATGEDQRDFRRLLGKKAIIQKDVDRFQEILITSGTLAYVQKMMHENLDVARIQIEKAHFPQKSKIFFVGLVDYLAQRSH